MSDVAGLRGEFAALERVVYLNTPTAAPPARGVLEATRRAHQEWESGDFSWQSWEEHADETRALFARLIGAQARDVALLSSLSEAAATVAASIPRGRVVVGEREFQSNLFPWLALEQRGCEVVQVPANDGVVRTQSLIDAVDGDTTLVAVTEVQSSNGFRVDLAALSSRCREAGARLFVNQTQALGALHADVDDPPVDYLAAHGYKWLLAPRGAAWLYVRPDRLDELRPLAPNWKSLANPYDEYYGGPFVPADDASKLDASLAWFSWPGARAALELLARFEPEEVERRCLALAEAFREGARSAGMSLVPQERPSQTVGVIVPDPDRLRERLHERRVIAAVRGGFLRVGFHAFNDSSDVEKGLVALAG